MRRQAGSSVAPVRPHLAASPRVHSLDYTHVRAAHYRAGNSVLGAVRGPPFERAPRRPSLPSPPSDPAPAPHPTALIPTCHAGPAAVPSCPPRRPRLPRRSFSVQASAPLPPASVVSWPCVYNNSITSDLLLPPLFLPSIPCPS